MEEIRPKPHTTAARHMARRIHKELGINTFPVILRDVARYLKTLDPNLYITPYNSFDEKIDGVTINEDKQTFIGFRGDRSEHRGRFTLAHELGHYKFNHAGRSPFDSYNNPNSHEIEANTFAAELLMPLTELRKDLQQGKKPKNLVAKYNVSEEAIWWQIKSHCLIKYLK